MTKNDARTCFNCNAPLAGNARFCASCGIQLDDATFPVEVALAGRNRVRVSQESLSVRELLSVVESGVYWWQQRLQTADEVGRERAAEAIKDLSRILESLSQQLAQGRETIRITTRLPTLRAYDQPCPACGRGNRAGAKFCLACGALLAAPVPTPPAVPPPPPRLSIAGRSDTGRVRKNNEDVFYAGEFTSSDGRLATLLLVADGMGGAEAGDVASALARDIVKRELVEALSARRPASSEEWHALLRQAVVTANTTIYEQARANPAQRGMGTTFTLAVVADQAVYIAHVGDSRAYLINPAGVTEDGACIVQLTADHSLVARLVDIGQLTPEQARVHPHRNMLYRSLGTDATVEVDTLTQPLRVGDLLLLCSDGLDSHVDDNEILKIATSGLSPAKMGERLVDLANERGGRDNISVVIAVVRSP